ncbi:uncharacterized protein LOC135825567 [Sycon ciliatum]|uniref:uncharacterized protein LOC135825567 n=1 Tax=Sycon ciliatum TaxID=27933 RepID=UPI0031F7131A
MVAAMDHAGIGVTHVNNFLTTLNIPPVNEKVLRRQERAIGTVVERVAKESCDEACAEEVKRTSSGGIGFGFDCGWQKRGRAMNSLTGVGHAIGVETGRVIAYSMLSKRCATCDAADRLKRPAAKHDCRKNHVNKSSKAMEPESIGNIGKQLKSAGVTVSVMVGDDDSSALKRLQEEIGPVEKSSDLNHVKKNLGNRLYDLKKNGHKELSEKVIRYVQKCFAYAIAQNRNDPAALKAVLLACVPHMYGDHSDCGSWCGYDGNEETYRHRSLPRGKNLSSPTTRAALQKLFSLYAECSTKLASHGSTQANESLNNIIASKQPKSRSYGSSPSFNIRVGAAIAQKNLGYTYVSKVMEQAGMSPSSHAQAHGAKLDTRRAKATLRKSGKTVKRRRLELKELRSQKGASQELREGTSYQSESSLLAEPDVDEIAGPVTPAKLSPEEKYTFVYFDLETTGFGDDAEIIQLAASVPTVCKFSEYVLPEGSMSSGASDVTGVSVSTVGGKRVLVKAGEVLPTLSLPDAIERFIPWLQSIGGSKPPVLIAHNCMSFDMRVLLGEVKRAGQSYVQQLVAAIAGFADSLLALKQVLPGRKSYKQEDLVKDILKEDYAAHSADADVDVLGKLVRKTIPDSVILEHSIQVGSALSVLAVREASKGVYAELRSRFPKPALSDHMAKKIANSGIRYSHLVLAFDRNRGTGIQTLLQERDGNGRVRVTKSSAIAKRIADHLGSERPITSNTASQATPDHASGSAAAAGAAALPPVPATTSRAMPQLSAQTLALYRRRRDNGYDLPDPQYQQWLQAVSSSNDQATQAAH